MGSGTSMSSPEDGPQDMDTDDRPDSSNTADMLTLSDDGDTVIYFLNENDADERKSIKSVTQTESLDLSEDSGSISGSIGGGSVGGESKASRVVQDQSYAVPECIIAIRDDNVTRHKRAEFEISDISANEMRRLQEEEKLREEVERLKEKKRKREEELAREERLVFLGKRLAVVYGKLEKQGGDDVNVSQATIDNLADMIRQFHMRNQLETELPILEKKQLVQEKTLRKRKRRKDHLQQKYIEATPQRMQLTNPDIAELCSPVHAEKVADQMLAMYDHERKHTFAEARQRVAPIVPDTDVLLCLRDLFLFCFKKCEDSMNRQTNDLLRCLTLTNKDHFKLEESADDTVYKETVNEISCHLLIKQFQKRFSRWSMTRVKKVALSEIYKNPSFDVIIKSLNAPPYKPPLSDFLDKCSEIGWFSKTMCPAFTIVDSRDPASKDLYTAYNTEGSNISDEVWPALVQPGSGISVKGVAMFSDSRNSYRNLERDHHDSDYDLSEHQAK